MTCNPKACNTVSLKWCLLLDRGERKAVSPCKNVTLSRMLNTGAHLFKSPVESGYWNPTVSYWDLKATNGLCPESGYALSVPPVAFAMQTWVGQCFAFILLSIFSRKKGKIGLCFSLYPTRLISELLFPHCFSYLSDLISQWDVPGSPGKEWEKTIFTLHLWRVGCVFC